MVCDYYYMKCCLLCLVELSIIWKIWTSPVYFIICRHKEFFGVLKGYSNHSKIAFRAKKGRGGEGGRIKAVVLAAHDSFTCGAVFWFLDCFCNAIKFASIKDTLVAIIFVHQMCCAHKNCI